MVMPVVVSQYIEHFYKSVSNPSSIGTTEGWGKKRMGLKVMDGKDKAELSSLSAQTKFMPLRYKKELTAIYIYRYISIDR
jgi:hypothetical protein